MLLLCDPGSELRLLMGGREHDKKGEEIQWDFLVSAIKYVDFLVPEKLYQKSIFLFLRYSIRSIFLQAGSSISPQNCYASIQCPHRFLEIDPEMWHAFSLNPCQPVTEWGFLFFFSVFRQICIFLDFFGSWSQLIQFSRRKRCIYQRLGKNSWSVCANNHDLSPKNGMDIWTFVRETCVFCAVALLLSFSIG